MTSSKCTSGSSELSSRGETGHCWSSAQRDFDVRSERDADGAGGWLTIRQYADPQSVVDRLRCDAETLSDLTHRELAGFER